MAAQEAALAPFRVGAKEVFLPNFVVTLHRVPRLAPNYARFTVPLWFSKLDLRDYLYHAYSVRVLSIRSYVKQSRIIQSDPESSRPTRNRWHRPRATKNMTVELEDPFVWPKEVQDFSEWNQKEVRQGEKEQKEQREKASGTGDAMVDERRRESMREQAKALLEGRERWRPGMGVGGPRERRV